MSDDDRKGAPSTPADEAPGGGQETWLDRLRAAIGLKGAGSVREDLAIALADAEVAAGFSPEERAMLTNILHLRDVRVDDIMVPRADIEAVEVDIRLGDLFARFRASGHSRMAVYRDSLDDPVGLVHIKDLMIYVTETAALPPADGQTGVFDLHRIDLTKTLASTNLVRNILFVPPSMPVAVLLTNMQASRMQMALVIDEYGGTDGLVSLEDAVEAIVGDIEDETDEDAGPTVVPDGKGGFLADARADLDELTAVIGEDIASGDGSDDVDTIGGLIFGLTGRIPVRGELIATPSGYEFEILDADPRRIKRVRIYRRPQGQRRRQRAPQDAGPVTGSAPG